MKKRAEEEAKEAEIVIPEIKKKHVPMPPLITQKQPTKRYLSPLDLKRIKIKNRKKSKK